jgi:hypothetical protein
MSGRARHVLAMKHSNLAAAIGAAVALTMLGPVSTALASSRAMPMAAPASPAASRTRQAAGPLTSGSDLRPGWAPVPYRSAQLSVPGSWLVEGPQQLSCGVSQASGMIFVGIRPQMPKGQGCHLSASLAWILPAGHFRPGIRHRKPTAVIRGIPVYRLRSPRGSVLYLVPDLGVRVEARGPKAGRVLATLARSPLSVVLRRGPAGRVPSSWTWRRFGGVRFATPRSWSLQHADQWATCGTGLVPQTLLLLDATRPPLYLPCPLSIPTATAEQAEPGLAVVTGKYAAKSVGEDYPSCRVRYGVRVCLSSVTGQGGFFGGVLIFSVSRPHQHAATFFLLGLSGSGASARAVFDSVRLAS